MRYSRHVSDAVKTELALIKKRAHVHEHASFGENLADSVAKRIGSWRFIITQTIIITIWCILNVTAFVAHWDPYPWILLNLVFSTQAAYTGPILLLASNRAAQKDRLRDDRDDAEIGEILDIQRKQSVHDSWTREKLTKIELLLIHQNQRSAMASHYDDKPV